jgi:phosphatidylserine/phosphatidylglycerophosphate/cardiolipin synthase-like enzyme
MAGEASSETSNFFLLVRVAPSTPLEFVTIQNVSDHTIDAKGWSVDDGEGWIRINASMALEPGARLSFCADHSSFEDYYPDELKLGYRDVTVTRHGTFTLADKGDQVCLVSPGGEIRDSFCYGTATAPLGWTGAPFTPMPKGDMAERDRGLPDSNSSVDWFRSCAGRSEHVETSCRGYVDPFTSPEDAQNRMVREIGGARTRIDACVYELGDPVVTGLFTEAERRGVHVTLLIEGQPVAGLTNSSKNAIVTLERAGCDVRLMVSNQSYRRYDCLHAKYFVVDGDRVTVMSENWAGGLESNRGWGVTVVSRELADEFTEMFRDDSSLTRRDVQKAGTLVRDWYVPPSEVSLPDLRGAAMVPVMANVSLIESPDTSFQGLLDLVSSATKRLLVEQLDIDPAWVGKNQIIEGLVAAAERGVQVRILLDQTFVDTSNSRNNSMTVNALNELGKEPGIDIQARLVSDYHHLGVLHNKGVIADDQVLVSSINWVDASVFQNREVGLIVASVPVSSFFADFFWRDWDKDPYPQVISLPWNNLTVTEGQPVVLDARGCRDNAGICSYIWKDTMTGSSWNGSCVMAYLGLGIHKIDLTVTDRFGNEANETMMVVVVPSSSIDEPNYLLVVPAGAVGLACGIWAVWKKLKGG